MTTNQYQERILAHLLAGQGSYDDEPPAVQMAAIDTAIAKYEEKGEGHGIHE